MALKSFKPTTKSRRFMVLSAFDELTKNKRPERALLESQKKAGGRNNMGRITVRHQGGGHKQQYRLIDFKRDKHGIPAKVSAVEYDPNRSARLALLVYADGEKRYIICPAGLLVGASVMSGPEAEPTLGNTLPLAKIPLGIPMHNVELRPGKGAQMVRTAGAVASIMSKEEQYAVVQMPSGEARRIKLTCMATIGQVGNTDHENIKSGKAGRKRWLGVRPTVRGVAMNPVDHPMGGGEGRTSGGGHPVTPWGQLTKGKKTRHKRKTSEKFIVSRRKK
jgi:large subunit ribosomal protein L2